MEKADLLAENKKLIRLLRWALKELNAIADKHPILEGGIMEIEEALIEAGAINEHDKRNQA